VFFGGRGSLGGVTVGLALMRSISLNYNISEKGDEYNISEDGHE
jgi:hypothetical protein